MMSALAPIRLLYVQGDADMADALQREMQHAGMEVVQVCDTAAALSRLEQQTFDLAVFDYSLPDGDGLQLQRVISELKPRLPTVMISGAGDERIAVEAMKLGVKEYLVKDEAGSYLKLLPSIIEREIRVSRLQQEKDHAQRALADSEARFFSAFENTPLGMAIMDLAGRLQQVNSALCDLLGSRHEELLGSQLIDAVYPDDHKALRHAVRYLLNGELPSVQLESRFLRRDGELIWGMLYLGLVKADVTSPPEVIAQLMDITQRKCDEESQRQAAVVFDNTSEGLLVTDSEGIILAVNRALCETCGYGADELVGKTPAVLKSGAYESAFYEAMWYALKQDGGWRGEIKNRRKSGEIYSAWATITGVSDPDGSIEQYVAVYSDVSILKASEERFQHLAHHDVLTGLPNRLLLHARLEHALERAQRKHRSVALLFIDLDQFKPVNDMLGHDVGDELLREVARRLQETVRKEDTVARLGGDEFVVLLEGLEAKEDAVHIAEKLLAALNRSIFLRDHQVMIGASIGIAFFPDEAADSAALFKLADERMYQAKEQGRNLCVWQSWGPSSVSLPPSGGRQNDYSI